MIEFLQRTCQLHGTATIADVASGTGFLAEIFLKNGNRVIGVEPNTDMRSAGQHFLRNYPRFTSIAATAEETTLDSHSIDMITVGQAFHWFDREKTRQEFTRILKPDGWVILAWNIARCNTPFLFAYEQFWQTYLAPQASDTEKDGQATEAGLRDWYVPGTANFESFDNAQVVDYEGLRGRVLSSSYSLTPEHSKYLSMLEELETIFHAHNEQGKVTIEYECRVCYGQFHR